jgi:signal transduction histidine kinase
MLKDERRILELLNSTGAAIASYLEPHALVQAVTDASISLIGARFGAFFCNPADEECESFLPYTLSGAPGSAFEKFGLPRDTPLFDVTFRGEAVRCDDVTQDPRFRAMVLGDGMTECHFPVASYLAVPVASRSGEVIGGLFFGHPRAGVFTDRSQRIVTGVAAHAAVALDNARLYDMTQSLLVRERAARAEAERMSELRDEFVATLSHELRTPLSAILGWSQVMRTKSMEPSDMNKALEVIERNARMQMQLIEDLLDMGRITSGKLRLEIQSAQPTAFVEAAIQTVKPAADAKEIRIDRALDSSAGLVSGDPSRLQQIVWNLLSNAIKFTPSGGRIQVSVRRVDSQIEIDVADNGMGIAPDFLEHVFERFRQSDAASTHKYGGLGLGLSIVKHLVDLHGGTVRVQSAGEGSGTTFTVRLPIANAPRVHVEGYVAGAADYRVADLTGLRVLAVDDDTDARGFVQQVLSDCGADVETAANAKDALECVRSFEPHVLISDIGMPGIDGYALLRGMRVLEAGRIPAIALTAYAHAGDRERALREGYAVHLSKPVEPSELVAYVADVAARARRR